MPSAAALWEPWIPYILCHCHKRTESTVLCMPQQEWLALFHADQNAQVK